jgi:hypothetical protein
LASSASATIGFVMDFPGQNKKYKRQNNIQIHIYACTPTSLKVGLKQYWSALATAPAETSAEAKEAFIINKFFFFQLTKNRPEGSKLQF